MSGAPDEVIPAATAPRSHEERGAVGVVDLASVAAMERAEKAAQRAEKAAAHTSADVDTVVLLCVVALVGAFLAYRYHDLIVGVVRDLTPDDLKGRSL